MDTWFVHILAAVNMGVCLKTGVTAMSLSDAGTMPEGPGDEGMRGFGTQWTAQHQTGAAGDALCPC